MFHYVYRITNRLDGKIYIGCHSTKNLNDDYMGSGYRIRRAIRHHGVENFEKEILSFHESREEMLDEERRLVSEEFVLREDTYNIVIGGGGGSTTLTNGFRGKKHNPLSNLKRSEFSKNQQMMLSEEDKEAIRNKIKSSVAKTYKEGRTPNFKGKKHSEETKKTIGRINSLTQSGSGNSQYGTRWINDGHRAIKIRSYDMDSYLERGFKLGRKLDS